MRELCYTAIGTTGALIVSSLGGWDTGIQTLVIFMVIDYVTGLIVAGVFKKSKKSENGTLNSHAGYKGVIKKGMMLLMVLIAYRLDSVIGWDFVRHAVVIAFLINELISILENAELMGVPIPHVFQKIIDILKKKGEEDENNTKTKS